MNNQFATQYLREEVDPNWLENFMKEKGADDLLIDYTMSLIKQGLISPERAIEIFKDTLGIEEMSTVGGGSTAGASFAPGAGEQMATTKAFGKKKYTEDIQEDSLEIGDRVKVIYGNEFYGHTGTIEDIIRGFVVVDIDDEGTYSMHISDVQKIEDEEDDLDEDAPRLAGSPAKTNKQGAKNLSAYSSVGFTKAPNAEEAGKKIKGVDVDMLWKEALEESRAYNRFKKEAAMRSKPDQLHQAAKMIQHKLDEVTKLLEFTSQMRQELSEGETTVEYKHNTKKVFERIHSKVVEVYTKVKGLK